ncbi:GTP-binding protein [Xanthobacter dioxanivorans]|uniref:GTP-binding protein n=1 Tax=Xanthobacter dioxanivorans TaxID=2528964 RepID=A0A974SIP4_9HYPH|nr:GTP-binding protein [Xanthobacter dioxanivorans]QRG06940.1 GTP-binding protein [Xanthobacter dioxanivorans]
MWLSALLHAHGARIVRVKGLLRTTAGRNALVLHGVQHMMHPPRHLSEAEDDGSPGFLVFITQGIDKARIIASLDAFLRAAQRLAPPASTGTRLECA